MSSECPTLHMLCGKIASGKSTLAPRLGTAPGTVLVAEDVWLEALFADELDSLSDYVRCSSKLRRVMGPPVTALPNAGVSVVLDFAANTVEQRRWMRSILNNTSASHQLHLLTATDEACLARLCARNASGDHPFIVTEAEFQAFSSYFLPPTPIEGSKSWFTTVRTTRRRRSDAVREGTQSPIPPTAKRSRLKAAA